jgi:hypothetical protein
VRCTLASHLPRSDFPQILLEQRDQRTYFSFGHDEILSFAANSANDIGSAYADGEMLNWRGLCR